MASEKFRYQLRQEAQQWREDGLINAEVYEQLATRYRLDELDTASRDRFIFIVLNLGFILLGLGAITFVAANWQTWSRPIKVGLLLSLFIGTNCAGFYLWRSPRERQSRLGQGLLLFGALSLGANIALLSQMFHQTGEAYRLYLIWGLGVWAMAYGLRLTSLGLMAIILMAIAYCLRWISLLGWGGSELGWQELQFFQQIPLIVATLFIPLAYYCRSRWLFGFSSVLITFALETSLFQYLEFLDFSVPIITSVVIILPPAWLWSYRDSLVFRNANLTIPFDPISRRLAVFYLGSLLYLGSFNSWWKNFHFDSASVSGDFDFHHLLLLASPIFFTVFSGWAWWKLGTRRTNNLRWRLDRNSAYMGITIIILGFMLWFNLDINPLSEVGTIMFNLLLFSLAIILINQSVKEGQRFNFWLGIILVALQIFSRMLEYNTGLILKAIALAGCGIAAILSGLWFERYLSTINSSNSSDN